MEPVTMQQVEAWVARCQDMLNAYFAENFPNQSAELTIEPGKRYCRIVNDTTGGRSAWAFIDMTNGDVLKPATWRAPAKHARGNINDEKQGMGSIGPYGPAYLK